MVADFTKKHFKEGSLSSGKNNVMMTRIVTTT